MWENFETWEQLLDHIRAGYALCYQAPIDHRPVLVTAILRVDGKVRVHPVRLQADPFTADENHLTRFRRLAGRRA